MSASSRGVPVSIYRPSNIVGHSKTGSYQAHALITLMLKGCLQMGIAPKLEAVLNLVPVDYVSRAIVHLSRQKEPCGQAFYVVSPTSIEWRQLIRWLDGMGYPIRQVSYEVWYTELLKLTVNSSDNILAPLALLFTNQNFVRKLLGMFHFECRNTLDELANNSIICPSIKEDALKTYFSDITQSSYTNSSLSDKGLRGLVLQATQ